MCDAVIHDEPARAPHRRGLLGHVGWDAAGSPSLADRLERALCDPVAARDVSAPTRVDDSAAIPRAVVHDEDSALAKSLRRLPPVSIDSATRARILERFEAVVAT
jgi:hypothetical protein